MAGLPTVVAALLQPGAYPEAPGSIELAQTHLSLVFLTDRLVYKLKKPVDFGFVDYTSLERRRYFCYREVELNRRLCPDVYLGVATVYRDTQGGLRISLLGETPRGEVVEYAVVMRRLPAEAHLDALLARGQVTEAMLVRVATRLARFHIEADTSGDIAAYGRLQAIRFNHEENFQQTERYLGQTITWEQFQAIRDYAYGFLEANAPLFQRRLEQGRVRDGHGDLHAAHICFGDDLYIYDCIEFNERFRYQDVASDMAFLAMDLDYHGRPDLSRAFAETYIQESGDPEVAALLPFYKCYRAYVRGKVDSFQLDDPQVPPEAREQARQRASRYFCLAYSYTLGLLRLTLLLTVGLIGTGKSTLARALAHRLGLALISSDEVRKHLSGLAPQERRLEPFQRGIYSPEASRLTYQEMFRQAREHLAGGRSVILDASFRRREERRQAREVARSLGADLYAIECVAPESVIRERLERRAREWPDASDARWELYPQIKAEFEPVEELPPGGHLVVDCSESAGAALDSVVAAIATSVAHAGDH